MKLTDNRYDNQVFNNTSFYNGGIAVWWTKRNFYRCRFLNCDLRFVNFIIVILLMSGCSQEKLDSVFMDGLPQLGFTIDYASFLNQDSGIIIGRHKEYNDSIPTQHNNSVEIYISQNKGSKWSLQSKFPFDDLIHYGNTIKSDTGFLTSLFSQNGDAYLLHINYKPEYSAELITTGRMRCSPIAFNDNLVYSYADIDGEYNIITMDSAYNVLKHIISPPLSQGVLWENELIAIRRYVKNNNLFVLDRCSQWESYTCPLTTSFMAELEDGICIAGTTESNEVAIYFYARSVHNPKLIYSSGDYSFVKDIITDEFKNIILVLGYKSGMFMRYKLVISNNLGKDWKTIDIPNSELYGVCSIYKNVIYLFLINNQLMEYRFDNY